MLLGFARLSLAAALGSAIAVLPLGAAPAQTPPARTFQPGFWQPIARVDPTRPVGVQFANYTSWPLAYGLTSARLTGGTLAPGDRHTFERVPVPAYFFAYLERSQDLSRKGLRLRYAVRVEDNLAIVEVSVAGDGKPSESTLNIDRFGAIYVS